MSLSYCNHCGLEVRKVPMGITGNLIEVEPHFCRRCGNSLTSTANLDVEDSSDELGELPDWDDLGRINVLEEVIEQALPENFKELTLEQLRRYIVQSIWRRFTGIEHRISANAQAERDQEYEEQMQRYVEQGTPPPIILQAPRSHQDETLKDLVRSYHLVWVNGLLSHLSMTPEEAERMKPEVEKYYYRIEPCDCDRVEYVISEPNPHFRCKA